MYFGGMRPSPGQPLGWRGNGKGAGQRAGSAGEAGGGGGAESTPMSGSLGQLGVNFRGAPLNLRHGPPAEPDLPHRDFVRP